MDKCCRDKKSHHTNFSQGAVPFRLPHADLSKQEGWHVPTKNCNCSICEHNGYLTIFAERKDIEWISGWEEMTSYKFATGRKIHHFCGTCWSSVCIDFFGEWKAAGDVIGINVSLGFFVSLPLLSSRWRNAKVIPKPISW